MTDLVSFAIDPEAKDLVFDRRGRLQMVSGMEARKQRPRLRLGTQTDEWFLDTLLGVPWLELMEKGVSRERIRAEVLKAIMRDEEIERVEELDIGRITPERHLTIRFVARLRNGDRLADVVEVDV